MPCLKYNDTPTCAGYEANKLCAKCDKNARISPEEKIKNTMMTTHKATCADKRDGADKVKAAMDKILKMFESDNLEIMARAVFKYPEGSTYSKPSDNWSFINRMLMLINGTEDARGFRQWKESGRSVMKGSHAFYIFAPKMAKVHDDKNNEDKMILTGFMTIPVFRYEDTEGEAIPEAPKFDFKIPQNFNSIIKELNLTIKTAPFHDAYGYYSPSQKVICMCTPEIKTFLHELAHAADDRIGSVNHRGGQQIDNEVVAEYSAAVLAHLLGYKIPLGNSKKYIESYSLKELMRQLNRCEKVISFIWDRTTGQGAQNQPLSAPMIEVRV